MKKFIPVLGAALLAASALSYALVGCKNKDTTPNGNNGMGTDITPTPASGAMVSPTPTTTPTTTPTPTPTPTTTPTPTQ